MSAENLSKNLSTDKNVDEASATPSANDKTDDNGVSSRAESFDDKEEFVEANTSFEHDDDEEGNENRKRIHVFENDVAAAEEPKLQKEATPLPTTQDGNRDAAIGAIVQPKSRDSNQKADLIENISQLTINADSNNPEAQKESDNSKSNLTAQEDKSKDEASESITKSVKSHDSSDVNAEKSNDISSEEVGLSSSEETKTAETKTNKFEKINVLSASLENIELTSVLTDKKSQCHSKKKTTVKNENENQDDLVKGATSDGNTIGDRNNNDDDKKEDCHENESDNKEDDNEDEGPDDDEIKTSPAYIPRGGRFYMHDLRANDDTAAGGGSSSGCMADDEGAVESVVLQARFEKDAGSAIKTTNNANQSAAAAQLRPSRADQKWEHDLYDDRLQRPKTTKELVRCYGRDIRKGELGEVKLKLNAHAPADSNDNESTASQFEDEDDDSETAPEFKAGGGQRRRTTRSARQTRRINSQTGVAKSRRRAAPQAGRRQMSGGHPPRIANANVFGSERRLASQDDNNYENRHPQSSSSRPFNTHQKRLGGPGGGFRRTITSTRYANNSASSRRQADRQDFRPRNDRNQQDDYSAANEATESTNGGDLMPPSRQQGGRGAGKRYTAQRHGNAAPVNFAAVNSSIQPPQSQKYSNALSRSFAPNQSNPLPQQYSQMQQNQAQRYNAPSQNYRGANHSRGQGSQQNNHNGNYGRGQQHQQRYRNQQYHQPQHPTGLGANYHQPPNFVQQNTYMENYPPLGAQQAPINYQQQAPVPSVYMPHQGNQRLRQPTDTVYYDTAQQQPYANNSSMAMSQVSSSSANQPREKRRLQIAPPTK